MNPREGVDCLNEHYSYDLAWIAHLQHEALCQCAGAAMTNGPFAMQPQWDC